MAKQIRSNRAPKFNAEEFLDNYEREQQEEIRKRKIIPEGSIDGNPWDEPPAPGMTFNAGIWKWVPAASVEKKDNLNCNPDKAPEIRRPGYSITGKKIPDNAELTNQSGNRDSDQSEPHRGKSSGTQKPEVMVEPEHQCTDTTVTPPKKEKSPSKNEAEGKPEAMPKDTPPGDSKSEHKTASEDLTTGKQSDIPVEAVQAEPVEQSKKSRVSAKMVDADFDALRHAYLSIVSLGEKKPVFLPLELRDSLEKLARVSGVPNLAPSHIVINILKAFFDDNRELINRKLSGEKLSV